MYAIVKSGGKQFRVEAGDVIRVERLPAPVGEVVKQGKRVTTLSLVWRGIQ